MPKICLTSRGSGVRIPQRPQKQKLNPYNQNDYEDLTFVRGLYSRQNLLKKPKVKPKLGNPYLEIDIHTRSASNQILLC